MAHRFNVVSTNVFIKSPDIEKEVLRDVADVRVTSTPIKTEDELLAFAGDADGILEDSWVTYTPGLLERLTRLKILALGSVGFDQVDLPAATKRGIVVTNAADFCSDEIADHTMALILALARGVVRMERAMHQGVWSDRVQEFGQIHLLSKQTLGLIGFGRSAKRVAIRARPFGFKILAYAPSAAESELRLFGVEKVDKLEDLLRRSDIISAHTTLNEGTKHMIGAKEIEQMKESAYLVNTSRGKVVDTPALIKALESKRIAGAALDVFEEEPLPLDHPLFNLSNVILTPHIAGCSLESPKTARFIQARAAADVLSGRRPQFILNPSAWRDSL